MNEKQVIRRLFEGQEKKTELECIGEGSRAPINADVKIHITGSIVPLRFVEGDTKEPSLAQTFSATIDMQVLEAELNRVIRQAVEGLAGHRLPAEGARTMNHCIQLTSYFENDEYIKRNSAKSLTD